jgi:hypothetical protein
LANRLAALEAEGRAQRQYLEHLSTGGVTTAPPGYQPVPRAGVGARADAAHAAVASSPEIKQAEQVVAQLRQQAELKAKAPPGQLYEHSERDITGRLIHSFYGDDDAAWRQFTYFPSEIRAGRIRGQK